MNAPPLCKELEFNLLLYRLIRLVCIVGIVFFFTVACGIGDSKTIRQSDYGDQWPLTVSEALLLCRGEGVYIYVNERYYPVNGSAQAQWRIDRYIGQPVYDLEAIWAYDEKTTEDFRRAYGGVLPKDFVPLRISIGPLIYDGLKLCK